MTKYHIYDFETFINSVRYYQLPIYIEVKNNYFPIPELWGVIIPINDGTQVAVCTKLENPNVNTAHFEEMIVKVQLDESTQVKVYNFDNILEVYHQYGANGMPHNFELFVVDNTFDKYIEIENNK